MNKTNSKGSEHVEMMQAIHDMGEMLLEKIESSSVQLEHRIDVRFEKRLKQEIDPINKRLDAHDKKFEEIINLMHTHHDMVLRRIERLEDENVAVNAVFLRHGMLTATA